jgi:hypothetical protein
MRAVAIKKGRSRGPAAGLQEMGTLRCEGCGEEFVIGHDLAFADKWLADKQAHWLERVLADVTTSAGSLEGTVADMGAPKAYFRRGNVLDRASL